MKYIFNRITLVIIFVAHSKCTNIPSSPCPNVFQYKENKGIKFGVISIPGYREDKTKLEATIAIHDKIDYDNPGLLDFLKSFEKTREDARNGRDILYHIIFPKTKKWPIVTEITLNNEKLCDNPEASNMNKWHYSKEFDYPKGPKPLTDNPVSPCDDVFHYKTQQKIKYGIISIPGHKEGKTILKALIGIYEPFNMSDTGLLYFYRGYNKTLEDAHNGKNILYKLRFPQGFQYWPVIEKITLDDNVICTGPKVLDLNKWYYEKEFIYPKSNRDFPERPSPAPISKIAHFYNIPPEAPKSITSDTSSTSTSSTTYSTPIELDSRMLTSKNTTSYDPRWLQTFKMNSVCGKRQGFIPSDKVSALIIGGSPVEVGEYPWMVAMFTLERRKSIFFCGGNLISDTHVITAAHCVKNKSRVMLEFGKHDLTSNDEEGYVVRLSSGIVTHPEYVDTGAHADIAVVFFEAVTFTHTIRPICMWPFETNFDFFRKKGTITGWGRAEQGEDFSDLPNQLQIERVNIDLCRHSHTLLRTLATDKTFCAGGNFTGPCQGDSGSGFYINHGSNWYLRGIISTSLGNMVACRVDKYAVYVDIIYYLEWIKNIIT